MRQFILQTNRVFMVVGGVILVVMTLQIGAGALARGLFNQSFDGNVEIAKYYYMVALSAFSLGAVQAAREHVIVEVFTQWMKSNARKVIDWCALVFTTIYAAVLAWGCTLAAVDALETREFYRLFEFDLALWPSRWFLAVGLWGLLLNAVYLVISRAQTLEGSVA